MSAEASSLPPGIVVLAGGESQRMGRADKLSLALDRERTVLGACLGSLRAAFPGSRIVAVGPEREDADPDAWTREDPPGGGPVPGIAAGLAALADAATARDEAGAPDGGALADGGARPRAGVDDIVLLCAGDMPRAGEALRIVYRSLRQGLGPAPSAAQFDAVLAVTAGPESPEPGSTGQERAVPGHGEPDDARPARAENEHAQPKDVLTERSGDSGRLQPLCAAWRVSALRAALHLTAGEPSDVRLDGLTLAGAPVRALLRHIPWGTVPVGPVPLSDIDTPADYAAYLQRQQPGTPGCP